MKAIVCIKPSIGIVAAPKGLPNRSWFNFPNTFITKQERGNNGTKEDKKAQEFFIVPKQIFSSQNEFFALYYENWNFACSMHMWFLKCSNNTFGAKNKKQKSGLRWSQLLFFLPIFCLNAFLFPPLFVLLEGNYPREIQGRKLKLEKEEQNAKFLFDASDLPLEYHYKS